MRLWQTRCTLMTLLGLALAGAAFAYEPAVPMDPAPKITRTGVISSHLASAGYDAPTQVLEVQFRSGEIYRYFAVPAEIHRALLVAPSKGHYFTQEIRGKYRFIHCPSAAE